MIENQKTIGWTVTGFRRYRPENRISRGMVAAAPWADLALLVVFYLFFQLPFVLQPGVNVSLPESPFADGSRYGHNIVVLAHPRVDQSGPLQEIVYFADQRYPVGEGAGMDELRAALARAARDKPDMPLVMEADARVAHGTLVRLFNMASDAGIREVNLATRPEATP